VNPSQGTTALHLAAADGKLSIVKSILKLDLDVNAADARGQTPLLVALQKGHSDVVEKLLKHSASVKVCDIDQRSVLHHACHNGREQGGVMYHGVDKEGHPILHFQVGKQKKGHLIDDTKQAIAFLFNQKYMESPGEQIITLFDFTGAGISNMDMDLSRFIINCTSIYFPGCAARGLMFKLHKALEAIWMLIKQWMDPEQSKNTVFVSKKNIQTYIDKDQLLPHMIKQDKK